ncbi:uncharacterized protein LOC131606008 [Vicia villosa]|uniref:uncharacterized protein LOC131606008 n=1 Tax=Vicia villosa TaxID=3911 RepID=UPI00273ACFDA|nr:uncharacterized protein LOC131606008 [Vicia villosa]
MDLMENLARLKEKENKLVKEKMESEARLKEEENKLIEEKMEFEAMQFIMSDTSKMNDSQREFHEKHCSNNDINVFNQSNVFNDILEGRAASVQYTINGTPYNMGYYLVDGIYPKWTTFVKTISMPQGEKRKLFAQHQESARKDVEWAFAVLQSRFAIICGPARAWHMETLKHTIYACIILHNMIVEDERHIYEGDFDYSCDNVGNNNSTTETFNGPHPNLATRLQRRATLREKQLHRQLQGDRVEHILERFGHEDDEN